LMSFVLPVPISLSDMISILTCWGPSGNAAKSAVASAANMGVMVQPHFFGALGPKMAAASKQNLLLLEHLNLNIASPTEAKAFYVDVLGCTMNPKVNELRQHHYNCGLSQFHCAWKELDGAPTKVQVLTGEVEIITVSPLQPLFERLRDSQPQALKGTSFSITRGDNGGVNLTCMNGSRFLLQPAPAGFAAAARAAGGHPGGMDTCVGMRVVRLKVRPGTAAGLARFYESALQANIERPTQDVCVVVFGEGALEQRLEFVEDADAPPPNDYELSDARGYHLCMYVASFESSFNKCNSLGAVWVNPRYKGAPLFDSATTLKRALQLNQFRIRDLRDPNSGELLLMLEHEVRSVQHPSCPLSAHPFKSAAQRLASAKL